MNSITPLTCSRVDVFAMAGQSRTDLRREAGGPGEQDGLNLRRAQQQLKAADGRSAGADAGGGQHDRYVGDRTVLPAGAMQGWQCFRRFTALISCRDLEHASAVLSTLISQMHLPRCAGARLAQDQIGCQSRNADLTYLAASDGGASTAEQSERVH